MQAEDQAAGWPAGWIYGIIGVSFREAPTSPWNCESPKAAGACGGQVGMSATRQTAVALMAKAPRSGEVKTRLCPPYSFEEAAGLYRCFLLDKMEQVRELRDSRRCGNNDFAAEGVVPVVSYAPGEARDLFESLAGPDFTLIPQRGGDLGARLAATFENLFAAGFRSALVLDSDTPTLPAEYLRRALGVLGETEADVVLGPSEDGGYYLIGLREPHPELFENVPWSTEEVLPETLRRAAGGGLRVARLPSWFDVDTPRDLGRLVSSLRGDVGSGARHTRRFLLEEAR